MVINLQRRINKEGHQIIPLLTDLWRRIEGDMDMADDNLLDLQTIGLRVDENEYSGVLEFVSDVQLMLKSAVQYYGFSPAVWPHIHSLFYIKFLSLFSPIIIV